MDRLADFALNSDTQVSNFNKDITNINKEIDIYDMFKKNIDKLVENASAVEFKNVLDLMVNKETILIFFKNNRIL